MHYRHVGLTLPAVMSLSSPSGEDSATLCFISLNITTPTGAAMTMFSFSKEQFFAASWELTWLTVFCTAFLSFGLTDKGRGEGFDRRDLVSVRPVVG